MNEISYSLRKAVIDALNPIIINIDSGFYYALNIDFGGETGEVAIPIFDERVNPVVPIPSVLGAKTYVLVRDQQENETTNDKCTFRQNALITLDCVTIFPPNVGSKYISEQVSAYIQPIISNSIDVTGWQILSVSKVNSQSLVEPGVSSTAYRKLITYSFDVYEVAT